jgi:hypothetical protein
VTGTGTSLLTSRRDVRFDRWWSLPAAVAAVPVVAYTVSALPVSGPLLMRAVLGFVVTLAAVALLVAAFTSRRPGRRLLFALLLLGLAGGWSLSAAGLVFVAAPLKVVGALSAGTLLGREMAERWWLLAAAFVAVAADLWSVFAGPTKTVVEEAPRVLDFLVVHFPAFAVREPATALGLSDFVFVGLFAAGARRTGLRVGASLAVMLASFPATLLLALLLERPLPALPLLCLGFVAVNASCLLRRPRG